METWKAAGAETVERRIRLTPGKVYHPVYTDTNPGNAAGKRAGNLKCLKDRCGKYLLERMDGIRFWICYEDAGYVVDGDPYGE